MRFRWTEMSWVCLKGIHYFFNAAVSVINKTNRSKRIHLWSKATWSSTTLDFFWVLLRFLCCGSVISAWHSRFTTASYLVNRILLAKPFKIWLRLCKLSIRRSNRREFNPEDSTFLSSLGIEVRIRLQSRIKLKSNVSQINISSHCCSNQYFEPHIRAHRPRPRWSLKLNSTFLRINN